MGDFFSPPPGYPGVPDEPATPPPNIEGLSTSVAVGLNKAGLVNGVLAPLFDILMRWLTFGLGWVLAQALKVFAFIIRTITGITDEAGTAYGVLVSATLAELFGIQVDPASVSTRRGGADRQDVANRLGKTITNTFFSGVTANPAGGIVPTDAPANNFLSVVMNMELNGWLESWFTDAVSYHLLEKYGDLKDGIAHVLGLGRLSRQVFSAPLQVLVHEPYLALLHQKYRSKALIEKSLIHQYFRGQFDRPYLSTALGNQGYSEQQIDWLIQEHEKYLPLGDVDYLLQRGIWTNDDAAQQLQEQGYPLSSAQRVVEVLNDRRIHKYRIEMLASAEAAFVEGNIQFDQWQSIAQSAGLADEEVSWILKVAGMKREMKVTHLSLAQIEQGVLDGVLNLGDIETWAQRVNMPADEEKFLELMVLFKQNKQTATEKAKAAAANAKAQVAEQKAAAAKAKAAQVLAQAPDKGLTIAQAELNVIDGGWSFDQFTQYLVNKGYGPDAITQIVFLLHNKVAAAAAKTTKASGTRSSAAAKGLSLAMVEKGVVEGILTPDDLMNFLLAHGYSSDDAQVIAELTAEAKAAADLKAQTRAEAARKLTDRPLSLAELERAVRLGLSTMDDFNAALSAAGFDVAAIAVLDGILNAQIAADKAKAATVAARGVAATAKKETLAQFEQEVIQGLRTLAEYQQELAARGYTADAQEHLVQLLSDRVAHAATIAANKNLAKAKLAAIGISLSQAERAVKLGVEPIDWYDQLLGKIDLDPAIANILEQSLVAEIAASKKTQAATNKASSALAKKGISLAELQKAVIAGLRPIADFTSTLTAAGYSDADAATMTQLLELKVEQAAEAAARHADAEGRATMRGISLANEEQAVIQGDKTMDDYDALLTALGYDDVDRATLEFLLNTKVTAAAAKAAKGGTGGTGGTPPAAPTGG